jgi:membrane protease subunit HflK
MKNTRKSLLILGIGLGVIAGLIVATGLCRVAPGEVVVVRRLGRPLDQPWGPGLHWHMPLGIDRLDRVQSDAVRQFTVGQAGPAGVEQEPSEGEGLTGDLNLVRIQASVQYRVASPRDYVLRSEQVEGLLIRTTEASVSRALARRGVDPVLRSDRRRIADEVEAEVQSASDSLSLGVKVLGVSLTDVRPPLEVAADFAAAQSAESLRDQRINQAKTYEAVELTAADARGRAIRESAHADAEKSVLRAQADARRFLALLAEVARSRQLTMSRLYVESLQSLLDRVKRKLILPAGDATDITVIGLGAIGSPRSGPEVPFSQSASAPQLQRPP